MKVDYETVVRRGNSWVDQRVSESVSESVDYLAILSAVWLVYLKDR